jgi:hypothetical protein
LPLRQHRALMRKHFILFLLAWLLVGCSSLTLGYGQLPRLSAWWVDSYLDLDRAQTKVLDHALQRLLAWHRREELPRLQALLLQAEARFGPQLREADLLALEAQLSASLQRTLEHAAPLATPLLASLKPAQWQHLQARQAKRLDEWDKDHQGPGAPAQRERAYLRSLERWLGEVERPLQELARTQARGWQPDVPALRQAQQARQALALEGLRAWAAGQHEQGTALLMRATLRDAQSRNAAEAAQHQQRLHALHALLLQASPAQVQASRAHWARWRTQLGQLQRGD